MTSVNERQYQLPFCQVLAATGETILYVSTHGPFEKGKDVITRTSNGEVRAYQLKAGDISLNTWRNIHGEIDNLVELAIELPGKSVINNFVPYLVTNGELTDPVLEQIRVANLSWQSRGIHKQLHVIQRGELFERFRTAHGAYLPHELTDFRNFLELILHDGSAPAEKSKAAQLIEHVLDRVPQSPKSIDIARAVSSIVLLVAYLTGPATLAANYWSIFEYWVMAGAYVLYVGEKFKDIESCEVSFDICQRAADFALDGLANECLQRINLVEGFPLLDGHTYRPRMTLLVGLLCGWDVSHRIRRIPDANDESIASFVNAHRKHLTMWGESAVPYLYIAALHAERICRPQLAEDIVIRLITEITAANGHSAASRGIPNPYYSPEEALRLNYGLDFLNQEHFAGFSYSISPLIEFLARRWRRQALASLWFGITRMSLLSYVPGHFAEWFRWRSSNGALDSRLPAEPQSWEGLRTRAEHIEIKALPPSLIERPAFAVWFVLVYPHRFNSVVAKLIEDALIKLGE